MSTDLSEWFVASRKESWCSEADANVLEPYLNGSISVEEATEKLAEHSAEDKFRPVQSRVGRVWTLIFMCAEDCYEAHSALINLIKSLQSLPKPDKKGVVDWSDEKTSFSELWRSAHDSLASDIMDPKHRRVQEGSLSLAHKWSNFHAFCAACTASDLSAKYWGLSVIVEALEKTSSTAQQLNANALAACQWLIHASRQILWSGEADGTNWGNDTDLWKGSKGFSRERWNFWKQRLSSFEGEDVDDEVKDVARKAAVAMGKAERAKK